MLQFTRLRLIGFKSFVEPTDLAIEPGLTGIVGPNGCGKSNLVEALRWAMGESSSRALRGGDMEDVIFAGTAERPGRGFAEVSIALDNAARAAPPPFADEPELLVSRRIERGRGSVYRINGREVRARDVQLLFADHAAGARSAAMVTQGQVSQLIAAKPAERRALLEEAAGIGGLASRRGEAEGRLAAAEHNLTRVEDVLTALAAQRRSLQEQAAHAARYRALSAAIRQAEIAAFRRQWRLAETAVAAAEAEAIRAEADVVASAADAIQAAARQAGAAAAIADLRQQAAAAAEALFAAIRQCDQLAADEALLGRELTEVTARHRQLGQDLAREQALAADADTARDRLLAERDRLCARAGDDIARRAALAEALEALTAQLAAEEGRVAALEAGIAAGEAERSALKQTVVTTTQRVERLRAEERALAGDAAAFAAAEEAGDEAAAAVLEAAEARLEAARCDHAVAQEHRQRSQTAAMAAREAAHRGETAMAVLAAEQRTLAGLVACARPAAGRPVLDDLVLPAELAAAVAAAFGDELLATLDDQGAAFWRSLPAREAAAPLPAGAVPLAEHVGAPPPLAHRLAATGIVDDPDVALALQSHLAPGQRLVSTDGRMWRWDGLVQPTPPAGAAATALAQRERLAAVVSALATAGIERETAAAAAAEAADRARAAEAGERAARAAEREAEAAVKTARERRAAAAARVARRSAEGVALDARRRHLGERLNEALAEAEAAAAAFARLPDLDAMRREAEPARRALALRRNAIIERRAALATHDRDVEARHRRAEALTREIADWQRRAGAARHHIHDIAARHRETGEALAQLAQRPALLKAKREAVEDERLACERVRDRTGDELATAEAGLTAADQAMRAAESAAAAAREKRIRADAALAQAHQDRAQLGQLIEERLGMTAAALAAEASQDGGEVDVRKLERMRRERDLMGAVNLLAEEEGAALADRMDRLAAERADLEAAIGKLRRAIGEIDGESRQRLLAAFTDIDGHFRALFARVFGGGRAELRLTDSDDPLAAGLEIFASPPGKRLSLLSLLSGGEQALTAVALRFAVFLTRPAPICVLDEVDAPLDDANVDRFCRLLDDLVAHGTRFLVITHHRLTMARMDRLYGVTMAEKGISRLLSVDLRRAGDLRQHA